ncbi:MAG: hypothetical protein RR425_00605, partial [Erysipelotrichales bacterium]
LFLLYLSAYLHDSAMALPQWEYEALKAVEGTKSCYDNSVKFAMRNDLKATQKYSEVREVVCKNKDILFDYSQAKDFIFAPETEEGIIEEITSLILEYDEFRSGFYDKLKVKTDSPEEYVEYSKRIRTEFIRQTHHLRVEKNITKLTLKFKDSIGELQAKNFTDLLANICRAHGENLVFVKNLPSEFIDFNNEKCNAQFIAILLRLGDIIHFDNSRAPISLFAEKQIDDPISKMHWTAKEQELGYKINSDNENTTVEYTAYCKNPETYYFIQDYMDWIDNELSNYYHLKNCWQSQKIEKYPCYDLPLTMNVNRSRLSYDSAVFQPDREMKFVLNQTKILELLAGVQLYQDRLLCLRELYQNALDTSKCMRACNSKEGITQKLPIVFGLDNEIVDGKEQKYIYCLDHGMGMDDYIIKNYLLKIGTSYYKSADFMKVNADWNFDVTPTSQFGIGLLSGYMLADKIGVTSVYWQNKKELSCIIGNNDYFYYNTPKKKDLEKIGNHGTLIKLYLNPEYSKKINNKSLKKLPLFFMNGNTHLWKDYLPEISEDIIQNNLQFILFNQIGIPTDDIPVLIEYENRESSEVFSAVTIFDFRNYPDIGAEDVEKLWSEYFYVDGSPNPYKEVVENRENIADYIIKISTDNIKLYSHIALPHKGGDLCDVKLFDYCQFLGNKEGSIYVDGVYVDNGYKFSEDFRILGSDIVRKSIVNFDGVQRPILSVDRKSIVSLPQIDEELKDLRKMFISELVEIIKSHAKNEKYDSSDSQISLILDIIIRKFPSISNMIIQNLQQNDINIDLFNDEGLKKINFQFSDLFLKPNIYLNYADFRNYRELTRKIIIGRLLSADSVKISDNSITVEGEANVVGLPFDNIDHHLNQEEISLYSLIIKADKWDGEYSEYDMVNSLWPIVSPNLYNKINGLDTEDVSDRMKSIGNYGNSIAGIANIDPVMIYPDIGISSKRNGTLTKKRCYVGVIEDIMSNFYLSELTRYEETHINKKESYVLYVFYNRRELNALESNRFSELKNNKKEYCKGLEEGFSVLYIGGNMSNYIIRAGKVKKDDILKDVPESFWEESITYYDVGNNIVQAAK